MRTERSLSGDWLFRLESETPGVDASFQTERPIPVPMPWQAVFEQLEKGRQPHLDQISPELTQLATGAQSSVSSLGVPLSDLSTAQFPNFPISAPGEAADSLAKVSLSLTEDTASLEKVAEKPKALGSTDLVDIPKSLQTGLDRLAGVESVYNSGRSRQIFSEGGSKA